MLQSVWQVKEPAKGYQCHFSERDCRILLTQGELQVSWQRFPVVLEEELYVTFEYPNQLSLGNVWIEGINMYMGKVPVLIQQTERGWSEGITYLGSCSEPNMRWRMVVELFNNQSGQRQRYFFNFTTRQYS